MEIEKYIGTYIFRVQLAHLGRAEVAAQAPGHAAKRRRRHTGQPAGAVPAAAVRIWIILQVLSTLGAV